MHSAKTDVFSETLIIYRFSLSSKVSLVFFLVQESMIIQMTTKKLQLLRLKISFSYGVGWLLESIICIKVIGRRQTT